MSTVKVSTVEFRSNIYKYLNRLPIEVTAKGKTIFFVVKDLKEVSTHSTTPLENTKKKQKNKIDKVGKIISDMKGKPVLCPKHGGLLIGDKYACCG